MLTIRKANNKDADTIASLGRVTFTEAFGHLFEDQNDLLEYFDRTFSTAKISGSLQKADNVFWLAYWNDQPVGYAKLKLNSPSEFIASGRICQLQKIYVLKDFLSMKIGLKLQETLLQEAKQQGFDKIWLSVWTGNDRAIRFYEKNRFNKVGNHDFSIGKEQFDFEVMVKELN